MSKEEEMEKDLERVEAELKARLENMSDGQAMNILLSLSSNNPDIMARYGEGLQTSTTLPTPPHTYAFWNGDFVPPDGDDESAAINREDFQKWWGGRHTTFPEPDKVAPPEFDVDQLLNLAMLSQTPSLQRAVDELAAVVKRLIEKYHLGLIASLALVKLIEVNTFQALAVAVNEQHSEEEE